MRLAAGARLGPHEILAALGECGMGEVRKSGYGQRLLISPFVLVLSGTADVEALPK